jgi:hypothetical protein
VTTTKPTRGTNHSRLRIPSTVCPAPSTLENSHERPASPPLQYPQELTRKSRCPNAVGEEHYDYQGAYQHGVVLLPLICSV